MFGGPFGAFRSKSRHFFDETSEAYKAIGNILRLRKERLVLRRGRQYLRQISRDGRTFFVPQLLGTELRSVVAWSRILSDEEMLLAFNTSSSAERVYAIVDAEINATIPEYRCLYSTDPNQLDGQARLTSTDWGARIAEISVPPGGFTIWGTRRT
jgi:hypothetical protein